MYFGIRWTMINLVLEDKLHIAPQLEQTKGINDKQSVVVIRQLDICSLGCCCPSGCRSAGTHRRRLGFVVQ